MLISFLAGTATGVLIGFVVLTTLVSFRLEAYYKMNVYLESAIEERDARLEQLEKSINKGNYILKQIEIVFICEEEETDMLAFDKELKKKYSPLLGREVMTLDAEMIAEVVDKRIFRQDDKDYQLFVKKLIMADTLKIWVEVRLLE